MKKVTNYNTTVELVYEQNKSVIKITYPVKKDDNYNVIETNTIELDPNDALDVAKAIKFIFDIR